MARVITADTFNRWWAALDGLEKKASRTSSGSQDDYRISGVHDVRTSLVICTSPLDTHVVQDGSDASDGAASLTGALFASWGHLRRYRLAGRAGIRPGRQ
jgi:hypothetical protein